MGEEKTQLRANSIERLEARVTELETLLAHSEATVEELSDALASQWKTLDELAQRVKMMSDRVKSLEHNIPRSEEGEEPPPPHY